MARCRRLGEWRVWGIRPRCREGGNQQRGVSIDARTAPTRWTGEAMDYQIAIDSLLYRERHAARGLWGFEYATVAHRIHGNAPNLLRPVQAVRRPAISPVELLRASITRDYPQQRSRESQAVELAASR